MCSRVFSFDCEYRSGQLHRSAHCDPKGHSNTATLLTRVQDKVDIESMEQENDRELDHLADRVALLKNVRGEG